MEIDIVDNSGVSCLSKTKPSISQTQRELFSRILKCQNQNSVSNDNTLSSFSHALQKAQGKTEEWERYVGLTPRGMDKIYLQLFASIFTKERTRAERNLPPNMELSDEQLFEIGKVTHRKVMERLGIPISADELDLQRTAVNAETLNEAGSGEAAATYARINFMKKETDPLL